MANDTRSSRKIRDDVSNSSKKGFVNGKGSSTLGSGKTDASGLRRSARETSSRKEMTSSPSNTRKSERLEKRVQTTPPIKKKSERVEKQRIPSPLRRSDRCKKHTSSSSSGSKNSEKRSGSSYMKQKKRNREKSVKHLAKEFSRGEKQYDKPSGVKTNKMDAHTFKALFRTQQRKHPAPDIGEELERQDKLSQADGTNGGDGLSEQAEDREAGAGEGSGRMTEEFREEYDEKASEGGPERSNSILKKSDTETSGNHVEVELSYTNQKRNCMEESNEPSDGDVLRALEGGAMVKETVDAAQKVLLDHSAIEKLQSPELAGSASIERSADGNVDVGNGKKVLPSKRKRHTKGMENDASTMLADEDTYTSIANDVSSPLSECKGGNSFEICAACSKRRRIGSPKGGICSCNERLNRNLHDSFIHKDRGEPAACVAIGLAENIDGAEQLKETSEDFQMDAHKNVCVMCKLGGNLLRCCGKDCKKRYHLSCLDPPFDDVPPGVWHCLSCVNKKIETGVHSVSEGVESIWDTREVEMSNAEGSGKQKQYFVKFKGLAHIHNCWVPESQLCHEAPSVVAEFNQKNQVARWNEEWAIPHRLLKKRLLMSLKQQDEYLSGLAGDISDCRYEWLVKWHGLDYEYATWELENASFILSTLGQKLIREYENRREKAKRAAFSPDKSKKGSVVNHSKLPAGVSPRIDNSCLNTVNKLHEYWKKCRNAVVLDDQERVMKVILFILSLSDVCHPILIITTSNALSSWEAEFMRFAPSIDVVVYSGNRDTRRIIRTLEFYEEGGSIMLQVLLSSPEAVVEDLQMLECLRWEATIVDECQHSRISAHFEQIKMLASDLRVLLFNGQLKDTKAEYLNLLSLLYSCSHLDNIDASKTGLNDNLGKLKERLSRFMANDSNSDSSRFIEYWVPVQISNVQLEQYCATLLSNSLSLCSCSKNDPVGALRDILISARKCCDHPYIVDPSLQGLITEGLPVVAYLDVGIKASGKLQLLDRILSEIKDHQLRVLILFQSIGGSRRDSTGDILDDFLQQRFGPDSYERVDGVVAPAKKQAALNKFNKESGRFVFLLENRACHPSIRLLSVDTIIIFDSDWNPANDIRALQRISIESESEQIKIFRLYSSCTVEEKVLILAKHGLTLDSNLQTIGRSAIDMLLMWGASYLFNRLEEFHHGNRPDSIANILSEESLLKDVVKEFLAIISQNCKRNDENNSIISKAQQRLTRRAYSTNIPLLGELKIQMRYGEQPHAFWTKLLEQRNPRWIYSSRPTQRNRKRVQYVDECPKNLEVETDEVGKKRKKVAHNCVDPASLKPGPGEGEVAGDKGGASGLPANNQSQYLPRSTDCVADTLGINCASKPLVSCNDSLLPEVDIMKSDEGTPSNKQKSLHLLLKTEISQLCEVLKFSEDIKVTVQRFLEYVIENHHVNREAANILQAFEISVCWIGASLLKQKIDRKDSLTLAKQELGFCCKAEEANCVYSKLRLLKKTFLYHTEDTKESDSSRLSIPVSEDMNQDFTDGEILLQPEPAPKHIMAKKGMEKSIKKPVQEKCKKWMKKFLQKQKEEIQEFHRIWEEKTVQLENDLRLELALVRSIHSNISVRLDKVKMLENQFAKKMEELKRHKDVQLKDIVAKQLTAREEERQKAAHCSCARERRSENELPLHGSKSWDEVWCSEASEHIASNSSENVAPGSLHVIEERNPDSVVHRMQESEVAPSDILANVPDKAVGCSIPAETTSISIDPSPENNEGAVGLERASVARIEQSNGLDRCSDGPENNNFANKEQITDTVLLSVQGEEVQAEKPNTAPKVSLGHVDSIELGIPDLESNGENDREDAINSDIPNSSGHQNNGTDSSNNGDTPFMDQSLEESPLVQQGVPDFESYEKNDREEAINSVIPNTLRNQNNGTDISINGTAASMAQSLGELPLPQPGVPDVESNGESDREDTINSDMPNTLGNQNNGTDITINGGTPFMEQSLGGLPLVQPGVPDLKSNGENNREDAINSDLPDTLGIPNNGTDSSIVGDTPSMEQSLGELPLVQPCVSPVRVDPLRQNLGEWSVSMISNELQDEDAPVRGNQRISQQVDVSPLPPADAGPTDQSNYEAPIIEPPGRLQQSLSTILCLGNNPPDLLPAGGNGIQPCSEGQTSFQNDDASSQLVENEAEVSHQAVSQTGANLQLCPLDNATDVSLLHIPPDMPSASRVDHLPDNQLWTSQNAEHLPQGAEDTAEPANQAVLRPGANFVVSQGPNIIPIHTAQQPASWMPSVPLYADPLQNELERICKETEQAVKFHEDTKLKLKSKCEKEIEEIIAQIRSRYEAKLQDAEAAFLLKKNELDTIHNRVLMNKILAEAFRSKCLALRPSGAPGMQQDFA